MEAWNKQTSPSLSDEYFQSTANVFISGINMWTLKNTAQNNTEVQTLTKKQKNMDLFSL